MGAWWAGASLAERWAVPWVAQAASACLRRPPRPIRRRRPADCRLPVRSPDRPEERLPDLPLPKKVVVGREAMWVDGWVFRIFPIGRQTISWFASQVNAWCRKDSSPENKAQIIGVLDAVEAAATRGADGPKQGEFEF